MTVSLLSLSLSLSLSPPPLSVVLIMRMSTFHDMGRREPRSSGAYVWKAWLAQAEVCAS
jgi:hypothetical protein